MKQILAPIAALLIGVSILMTGQGLQGTLLPMRAGIESFPTIAIGAMGAAYFLGFTIGCLQGGELVRRVGHVRVFLAMTALGSATPLVHGLVLNEFAWGFLRMVAGFCFAVLYVVIESWLNERSTNENRGTVFSIYVMISLSVLAAGQMMTLLYDPQGCCSRSRRCWCPSAPFWSRCRRRRHRSNRNRSSSTCPNCIERRRPPRSAA